MRVRCDRDSRAQVYILLILKTLGKLGKKCVAKYGNARPRPKQDTSTYVGVLLVLKKKGGFSFVGLIDTNPRLMCQLMRIFFSKAQRANHLTPHRLINAAPCKPTFSLPHACKGILMSLVASTRQTPSILPRLVLVAFCKL